MAEHNPGSNAAIDAGCRCPVMDNNHGKYPPFPPDSWYLSGNCPIHGFTLEQVTDVETGDRL